MSEKKEKLPLEKEEPISAGGFGYKVLERDYGRGIVIIKHGGSEYKWTMRSPDEDPIVIEVSEFRALTSEQQSAMIAQASTVLHDMWRRREEHEKKDS